MLHVGPISFYSTTQPANVDRTTPSPQPHPTRVLFKLLKYTTVIRPPLRCTYLLCECYEKKQGEYESLHICANFLFSR
jgi:hypothetical protein